MLHLNFDFHYLVGDAINEVFRYRIYTLTHRNITSTVTKVSLGPCNFDDTSKADLPLTSSPSTDKISSPYQKDNGK